MKRRPTASKTLVRFGIGIAISALLLVLLFRNIDTAALLRTLATADFRFLPIGVLLYFLGVWIRSVRWRMLLPPGQVPIGLAFQALVVGFTVNNLLPARLGEFVRALLLKRWCGVHYGSTLASVVIERILDGLALAALLLVALALVPMPAPGYLLGIGLLVGGAFAGVALLLALTAWRHEAINALAGWLARRLPARLGALVQRAAAKFLEGLHLVHDARRLAGLAALSLLAWTSELGLFYVLMFAFPMPASFALAALGGTSANFATLIPSSPGYVGTFDAALVRVLVDTASLSLELATAYTLLVHATLYLPVVLLGIGILWRRHLNLGQLAEDSAAQSEMDSDPAQSASPNA